MTDIKRLQAILTLVAQLLVSAYLTNLKYNTSPKGIQISTPPSNAVQDPFVFCPLLTQGQVLHGVTRELACLETCLPKGSDINGLKGKRYFEESSSILNFISEEVIGQCGASVLSL